MNHNGFKGYKPTQKQAHLQTAKSQHASQSLQKSLLCQRTETKKIYRHEHDRKEGRSANSGFAQRGLFEWKKVHVPLDDFD